MATANREAHAVQCSTGAGAVPAQRTSSKVLCSTNHCVTPTKVAFVRNSVMKKRWNAKLSVSQASMLETNVYVLSESP
jgi:hypothetical protein